MVYSPSLNTYIEVYYNYNSKVRHTNIRMKIMQKNARKILGQMSREKLTVNHVNGSTVSKPLIDKSRDTTRCARAQPRGRRSTRRIMAERRRHKKRTQVNITRVMKDYQAFRLRENKWKPGAGLRAGLTSVNGLHPAADEGRRWLTLASISWLATTNISGCILIRRGVLSSLIAHSLALTR